jgi:hypothetical protein
MGGVRVACLAFIGGLASWPGSTVAQSSEQKLFSDQILKDAAFDRGAPSARVAADALSFNGRGLVRSRTSRLALSDRERVTLSLSGRDATAGGQALGAPSAWDAGDADRYEVAYQRDWPAAVRGRAGGLSFEVTPRAGLGVSDDGRSAGAGATLRIGEDLEDQVVDRVTNALGLKTVDGESFGDRGRWYLFAAADGQAVGMNMLRSRDGGWTRGGWSADAASSLVSEAQVGVGWRKGAMQASFGYMRREIKVDGIHNAETTKMEDDAVAFSISLKPAR